VRRRAFSPLRSSLWYSGKGSGAVGKAGAGSLSGLGSVAPYGDWKIERVEAGIGPGKGDV